TMAIMVYAKQQAWKYANYRFDQAYEGLPLHKEETDLHGNLKYLNVNKQLQGELFTSNPVVTQKEEVERVQKALQAKIDAAGDQEKKSALIATFLLPLARTNTERENLLAIRTHLADAKAIDQLKKDFKAAFDGAVA